MSLEYLAASARKDAKRLLADPVSILICVAIPALIGSLVLLVSGGGGGARGHLLLADQDGSLLGRFLAGAVEQEQVASLFDLESVSAEEGRARMWRGEATALIVLPKGATDAILDESPVTITLVTNPAQRVLPDIIQQGLELLVETVFYGQRLFGEPIRSFRASRPSHLDFFADANVAKLATEVNQRLKALDDVAFPPVLELAETHGSPAPASTARMLDVTTVMLPGLIFMAVLFVAQGYANDLWEEQGQGTLRRAVSAPPPIWAFLAGKLAATVLLVAVVSLIGLLVGVLLFDLPIARALLALPWCIFSGAAFVCLFQLPTMLAATRRGGGVIASVLIFPLMMLGGSFFPFDAMPEWMARIGRWTPNGQAVVRLKDVLAGTASLQTFLVAAAAIGVPAALAFVATDRLVRQRFERGW